MESEVYKLIMSGIERYGLGVALALVVGYFYRRDLLSRDSEHAALLKECMDVIKQNSAVIAAHTEIIRNFMADEKD